VRIRPALNRPIFNNQNVLSESLGSGSAVEDQQPLYAFRAVGANSALGDATALRQLSPPIAAKNYSRL
jgi:hypothetical protein